MLRTGQSQVTTERAKEDLISPQDDVARGSTQSYAGEYELEFETPFVQTFATAYEGFGAEEHMAVTSPGEGYVPFADLAGDSRRPVADLFLQIFGNLVDAETAVELV